jgi:hypothetical protein
VTKNITAEQTLLKDLLYLKQTAEEGQPLQTFQYSISMARIHLPSRKEYICRADSANPADGKLHYHQSAYKQANQTLLNYLLEQPDDVTCSGVPEVICNQTKVENFDWSYRLALYMVQRNTWKYLGDDYNRYLLGLPSEVIVSKGPTCFNPIMDFNSSVLTSAERRWQQLLSSAKWKPFTSLQVSVNDPNFAEMKTAIVTNLKYHIQVGFQNKGVVSPTDPSLMNTVIAYFLDSWKL